MLFLKQSTAFTFRAGPFVDSTDGVTAETGLTINQADCQISKAGAAFAQKNDATGGTHDADGWYSIPFNTTDTATLGSLQLQIAVTGALPVFMEFMVLTANVWDTLCSTDSFDVNVTAMAINTVTASAIQDGAIDSATFAAGAIDATAIASNAIDADAIASNAIAAAKIATGAITASKFAAGAIDAAALATDAVNEIVDQVWDEADSDHTATNTMGALQNQISNLTSGSAAISTTAESFTKAGAEPETNTYTATVAEDGTYHIVEDDTGATDCYYQFDVGGNGVPVSVTWIGYAQSNGDSYTIWAYNYGGTAYEQIGSVTAANGTTPQTATYDLTSAHVGTGANLGKVRFRFLSADGTAFATDRLLCSYAVVAQSVGYSNGSLWIDTNGSNTNTESYVDGTADNPVSTWAAALTLSTNLGLTRFTLVGGSSITLTGNSDSYEIEAFCSTVALGGQSVSGARFIGATITGNDDGSNTVATRYEECTFGNSTLGQHTLTRSRFTGNITLGEAGDYLWDNCSSFVAGNGTPDVTFPAGNANLSVRHYSGGMEINSMAAGDTMSYEGDGQFKIAATCSGGDVSIRGNIGPITDAAGGAVTLTEDARIDTGQINAQADLALSDYDPPTNAEMEARTLLAAEYGTLAGQSAIETDTQDIQTKVGTPVALDGAAATLGAMLTKMSDDNGGADFDATTDSLEKLATASTPAAAWDALIASHDIEDSFGNVINDLVQENGGTGVYEYKTSALANAPSGTGQTQYFVLGGANQDAENTITWHAYCLKNGAPIAGTDCTVQLYKDDGDGTITEVTGATDTVASPDANGVFNESMEVTLEAGALYYYYVTMTVDAATRAGFITLQVPERTAS